MLDYTSVEQASEKGEMSKRRRQKLCEENRIDGAVRFGHAWAIPKGAPKPADGSTAKCTGNFGRNLTNSDNFEPCKKVGFTRDILIIIRTDNDRDLEAVGRTDKSKALPIQWLCITVSC